VALAASCGLDSHSVIADIGSGTGILTELLLENGNHVYSVEPNAEMRIAAERLLSQYARLKSVNGAAENTTLPDNSVDFVTAAQAFHWFDLPRARAEFARILKPGGWAVLLWNERRLNTTAFLKDLESLLLKYGTDYSDVRHEKVESQIASFYAPDTFTTGSFENLQQVDLAGLRGRIYSASYTPEPGHPQYEPMVSALDELFYAHEVQDKVTIEYDTKVYYGHLSPQ